MMPQRLKYYRETISLSGITVPVKIFLAEGLSEALFLERLFQEEMLDPNEVIIFCIKGVNNLGLTLKLLVDEEEFPHVTSLGIMLDADTRPKTRFNMALRECRKIRFISTATTMTGPGVCSEGRRKLGIFVSPGDGRNGCIETLILDEVREKPEFSCLEDLVDCLIALGASKLSDKALCQMYISLKRDRVCGAGRAFESGIFDISHPAYEQAAGIFTLV